MQREVDIFRFVSGILALAILASVPACKTTEFRSVAPYGASTKGPEKAVGALVWLHGRSKSDDDTDDWAPYYLRSFRTRGWDVFRLDRARQFNNNAMSANAAVAKVRDLRNQGYKKVVLAGQSAGGWAVLKAATISGEMDAVIATAPASHGTRKSDSELFVRAASDFRKLMEDVAYSKVMIFLFAEDDYDPGGRGPVARSILSKNGVVHEIIDRPIGFDGHGAASTADFAVEFSPRMVRFIDSGPTEVLTRDISIKWPGYLSAFVGKAEAAGERKHQYRVRLADQRTYCTVTLSTDDGQQQRWSLACPDNRVAFGVVQADGNGNLFGEGEDLTGRFVEIRVGREATGQQKSS